MKTSVSVLKTFSAILLIAIFTACTSTEQKVVVMPTLAVLPSATATYTPSATSTSTPSPTFTATDISTPTATYTPTVTYTASMTPSPTPECFKEIWWEQMQPILKQFFDEAQRIAQLPKRDISDATISLYELQSQFKAIEYPQCVAYISLDLNLGIDEAIQAFVSVPFDVSSDISLSQMQFGSATQYFFEASENLRRAGFLPDARMRHTADQVWGGNPPDYGQATHTAAIRQTAEASLDQPLFQPAPTAKPSPIRTTTPRVITTPAVRFPSTQTGITTASHLYLILWSGPGENFRNLSLVSFGTTVRVFGKNADGTWLNVELPDGEIGWLRSDGVRIKTS